jgi:hypothetical protein
LSALEELPPLLRIYEGCGRALTGTVDDTTILKLHRVKAQVSYLEYPDFDVEPHPALATVVVARLPRLDDRGGPGRTRIMNPERLLEALTSTETRSLIAALERRGLVSRTLSPRGVRVP